MIELDAITKSYGGKRIVTDVSFAVARGQFCALVGPSGSGKSTTLRMINRLVDPDAGRLYIGGDNVTSLPVESLRRKIGYVIQSVGLFPHWSVADNIATVPRLLKWPESRVAARIDELLDLVRLDTAIGDKYPHQLSGGQQQRVGVARALAADPEILLMDEPFGALDPITRQALRGELARIHRATAKTTLFVTHDIDEALQLADTIAILRDGELVQFGTPLEILSRPGNAFVRDFVGGAELGLKLLAQRRAADYVRHDVVAQGDPIAPETPLNEALSQMVLRRTDRLPVGEPGQSLVGSIVLADMVAR